MRYLGRRAPAPSAFSIAVVLTLVVGLCATGAVQAEPAGAPGVSATSSATGRPSTRTALSLELPAGTRPGDVMLASVSARGATVPFAAPEGWVRLREDNLDRTVRLAIYHRVATASEPESYTWALDQPARMAGGITTYTGVDGADPVDVHRSSLERRGRAAVTAPSVTTTLPGSLLVHVAASATDGTMTPPSAMTERWEAAAPDPGTAGGLLLSSSDAPRPPAGPTGTRTATASEAGPSIGVAVALRPGGAGPEMVAAEAASTPAATAAEAQIVVVGSAWSESQDGRSSVAVSRPAGTQAGHVMVATVAVNGAPSGIVAPAGWNRVRDDRAGNSVGQAVFVREASASEPAAYTFTLSGKPQVAAGITTYSGVEPENPIEAHDARTQTGASVTAPSVVVTSTGARLVHLAAVNAEGTVTSPVGMTQRFEANSPHPKNNKDVLVALADEPLTAAGATGTRTATVDPAGPSIGVAIALRPAGSVPPGDTTPPQTTIDSGPSGTVTTGSATFTFSADEPVSEFRCRLDAGSFGTCASPKSYSGLANGTHTFAVAAVDLADNVDPDPATRTWTVEVPVSGDAVLVGAGDIASCSNDNDEATAQLVDAVVAARPDARVFTVGDNVYDNGTTAEFNNCYHPTWGRHKARTHPVVGNHEYGTAGAAGYFGYFGAAAGPAGQGYYDYMAGGWHVVVLNSQCNAVGGCHAGSAQEQWLRARLQEVAAECTVAIWHHPRFSSGSVHGSDTAYQPFWQALYEDGAELIVNGHDHIYERFDPQSPGGLLDTTFGVRQITAGLGGRSRYGFSLVAPNSQVRYSADYGVLKLTLRPGDYDFELLRVGGGAVVDSGTAACHGAPPVEEPPPPPPPVPGPIEAVGSTWAGSSTAQPALTIGRPANVTAGHVMVAQVVSNDDDPGFVAPAGWTLVSDLTSGGVLRQAVYRKVATASEPTSYTWALDTSTTRRITGGITAYSGVDTASPVAAHAALVQTTASEAVQAPSLDATVPDSLLLHLAAVNAEGTVTPPAGMTERWEMSSPNPKNARDVLAALADVGIASTGATGIRTAEATQAGPNIGLALLLRPAPATTDTQAWRSGNAYGAGYMNFVRFHPTDGNRVLLNTDIGGIHLSTDGGSTWLTRGRNVADYIASVQWHPTLPDVAYALAGQGDPGTGGVMVSEDGGHSWRMDSTTPTGHGNNTPSGDGLPRPHPRSTGQLLAVDAANGFLYAGTYEQGLMRAPLGSSGDPGAWTTVALAPAGSRPYFIRGLALDDQDPTTVYVATYGSSAGAGTGRVYRVAQAHTSGAVTTELTGSPRNAEEVRASSGHLYAVANDAGGAGVGAFRLATARTAGAATAWRRIAAGPSASTVTYYGIEIYKRGSTTTLWVTSDKAWRPSTTVAYKNMWRGTSTDDFATDGSWAALPNQLTDTPNDMAGPNGTPDPFWAITENNYGWPGKDPIYTASGITVSPTDPNTLIMAGQLGPWRSRDNGATWYPVPTGINILVQSRVTADPDVAGRVYVGSNDYRGFSSTDALRTARNVSQALKAAGAPNEAGDTWSVAVDTAAGGSNKPVYFGMGERDVNTFGQIWMDADPSTPTTGWTQVLDTGVSSGRRPIGLAVVRDPAAPATPIVLAVLQGGGMYRKVGSGSWTQASGFTSPIINGFVYPQVVEFAWRPGWNKIYVYDRSSGLWRSDDFGLTWTKLYSSPDTGTNKQGFVAGHPTNQNIVYLATSAGVSVIANAGTAGAGGATLGSLGVPGGRPGPVAVGSDGRIYVATQAEGTADVSRVYANALTASGTGVQRAWSDVADDLWRSAINSARELAVGSDGTVYAGTSGGVFVLDGGATLP